MIDLAYVLAGLVVGLIVGLTGVGGGSLMTPILIFFFGVKPYMAVGTELPFAAFTNAGGAMSLARQRRVPWRVVMQLPADNLIRSRLLNRTPVREVHQHVWSRQRTHMSKTQTPLFTSFSLLTFSTFQHVRLQRI